MRTSTGPMLRVEGLRVAFGEAVVLEGVSFEVEVGQLFGLIGPNGAGKTTLIETVAGFVKEAAGEIVLAGRRMNRLRPEERARLGLARTFQSLELFEELTVLENLLVASDRAGWTSRVLDLVRPGRVVPSPELLEIMAMLGLEDLGETLPSQLSNGQRKLVALARALASGASMMMLDEPAAGLDTRESQELGRQLRSLVDRGTTMLLIDHDMDLVLNVCDRVLVLNFGKPIAEGSPEEIRRSPEVMRAYLGVEDGMDATAGSEDGRSISDGAHG